jgi:hypothetical protein
MKEINRATKTDDPTFPHDSNIQSSHRYHWLESYSNRLIEQEHLTKYTTTTQQPYNFPHDKPFSAIPNLKYRTTQRNRDKAITIQDINEETRNARVPPKAKRRRARRSDLSTITKIQNAIFHVARRAEAEVLAYSVAT